VKARHKRFVFVAFALVGVGLAATLAVSSMRSNLAYYFSPSKVVAGEAPADALFRLGGLVVRGSLERAAGGLTAVFDVTDTAATIRVSYTGILPDLFGEGQGVVTKGRLGADGIFYAEEVLAKHDESYLAPEVAASLATAHAAGVAAARSPSEPGNDRPARPEGSDKVAGGQ